MQEEIQLNIKRDVKKYQVSKAKLSYYKSKVENTNHYDQSKWYKAVYKLAVAEELGGVTLLPENVTDITERLQSAFIKPWKDIEPTEVPDVDDVVSLLEDNTSATPFIGQIRSSLLIPGKQQELMEFLHGCLNALS